MAKTRSSLYRSVYEHYGYACGCCGNADREGLHIDHVIPRALGGTDTFENLQVLCGVCNSSIKRDQVTERFQPVAPSKRWAEIPRHAVKARQALRLSLKSSRR